VELKRVLIVDNREEALLILSKVLRTYNVEVITTTNIEEAESALKNTFFDLVITDIRLNGALGREGLELLSYIKEKSPETKVIVMTAHGSLEVEKEAYEKGAYFYFNKPVDLRILNDRLKKIGIYSDVLK